MFSVRELIAEKIEEQHTPLSSIYAPPESGFGNDFFIELYKGRKTTLLAKDVLTFTGNMDGLALGLNGGVIQLVGDWPCRSLALPPESGIGLMAWRPGSPIFALSEAEKPLVRVFELMSCAEIASFTQPSIPHHLAVSGDGGRLALVDEVYDLWIGPSIGPLTESARLRYAVLDMAFSPAGGIVLVVDQLGWITSWSSESGERIRTALIPGGPFIRAEIQGGLAFLTDFDGNRRCWNIPKGEFVEAVPEQSPFSLEDGMLAYTSPEPSYQKRLHLGRPNLGAAFSPSRGVLRISDIDGKNKYYSTATGLETGSVQTEDWTPLEPGPDAALTVAGETFRLADPVCRRGDWRLMARHTEEDTFYVWWVKAEDQSEDCPMTGDLPIRYGLGLDQLEWRRIFETNDNETNKQE